MAAKKKVVKKPVKNAEKARRVSRKKQVEPKVRSAAKAEKNFPIVGLGASAGGLEALEGFFSHMPSNSGMAFVVIQHLAPKHKSIMGSLLQKYTGMQIHQIVDGVKVQPNCIYLNPADKDVEIVNRSLLLMEPRGTHAARLPIDHFFCSLAEDQAERAICIVLSGTGTDGSSGVRAIKDKGGMTLAQDAEQAKYDNMPRSAMATSMVDHILVVEKMPEVLIKYSRHPYVEGLPRVITPEQQYMASLKKIFGLIRSRTGHDFSNYKQNTIQRRIERRMAVHQIDKIGDYVRYLTEESGEIDALFKDMLIMVTNFFRDPKAFACLEKKVIPSLLKSASAEIPLRIWVPGCGTGEEAYSLAILVAEAIANMGSHIEVQIFGTDLDANAIELARVGVFGEAIAANVTAERLKRFFIKEENTYKVKKQVREMLVFAVQNLIKDAPFSKLSLVSCRNLLIYMDTVLQKKILPLFHYILNPDGYLFLGSSETLGEFSDCFSPVDTKWKIFKRKQAAVARDVEHPILPFYNVTFEPQPAEEKGKLHEVDIRQLAERIMLQSYVPPGVLINEKYEILYFYGQTDKYLSLPSGEPSFNILKIVREELRYRLKTLLYNAFKEKKAVSAKGLEVRDGAVSGKISLEVKPITDAPDGNSLMMVIFESKALAPKAARRKKREDITIDKRVTALEQELTSTKEYLQTTIEELETSNEELKSTNEELQSTNEELQSTNEELETSREELQSTNEELETVNAELQDKVIQLSGANDDLNNLFGSTRIATIFLDMDLCIRRFTPTATDIFNLRQNDIGRPISDITSKVEYFNIREDARDVLETLRTKETEVCTRSGNWFSMRILPYRTLENMTDGVVITFVNIDKSKEGKELRRLATVVKDSNDAITVQELDGSITAWNLGAERMYGYSESEALKMNISELVPEAKKKKALDLVRHIVSGKTIDSLATQRLTKDGRILEVWLTATRLVDEEGNVVSVATTERDITEWKQSKKEV